MSNDERMEGIEQLKAAFLNFISEISGIKGAPVQKQQAFYRFDEGQMWMQYAIICHEATQANQELPLEQLEQSIESGDNLPA